MKPPIGKLPGKYDYQNEVNPNWEMSFREKLSGNLEGQRVEIDKKNSVIIANGNKAIFAEEVGVTVGDDGNEVRMIVDSENGEWSIGFQIMGALRLRWFSLPLRCWQWAEDPSGSEVVLRIYGGITQVFTMQRRRLEHSRGKKEDEQSIPSRIEMTQEEKEAYQNSLEQ